METSFQNAGQLALSYLCYIVGGEIAGDWEKFGGSGALIANLAHLLDLSVAQNADGFEIRARAGPGAVASGPRTRKPPAGQKLIAAGCASLRAIRLRSSTTARKLATRKEAATRRGAIGAESALLVARPRIARTEHGTADSVSAEGPRRTSRIREV